MSKTRTHSRRRYTLALPTLLAALAATRYAPVATPAALLLLCYLPGRILVQLTGLAIGWDRAATLMLSVAASLAIAPAVLNPLWHATNNPWALLAAVWAVVGMGLWLAERRAVRQTDDAANAPPDLRLFERRSTRVVAVALACLVTFATIGPYWPTELRGHPVPSLIHDFVKHHAVLFSLERRPLPLGNPFYADGAAGPVYYYHFFYLIPATVRALAAGLSVELAFGMMSALVALSTIAMFALIIKRFTGSDGAAILGALLASAVGAPDIVPVVLRRVPLVSLDAWADHTVRIHNFLTQMIWSPQNVLGILATLVGVYALSVRRWWKGWFILGPLLLASLVGSSVWVAMIVTTGLTILVALDILSPHQAVGRGRRVLAALGVAALSLLAVAPSLFGYAEMSRRLGKSLTTQWPYQSHALLGRLVPPGVLANLLDLPWVLALELGPLILLPLMLPRTAWKRAWQDPGLRLLLISSLVAIAGFPVFRSHFTYNDFGQKTMMVAMAGGVIMAACLVAGRHGRPSLLNPLAWSIHDGLSDGRRVAVGLLIGLLLVAGLPVGLYEGPMTAIRRYIPRSGLLGRFAHPDALRAAEEAGAYRFLRRALPREAVVQADWGDARVNLLQIGERQIGVTVLQADTLVFAPADRTAHQQCLAEVSAAMSAPGPANACHATLRRHRITHVFTGTLERQQWKGLEKLDDPRFFEVVFRDGETRILALR